VLIPFIALGLPLIAAKLMNAVFLFLGLLYFYLLVRRYVRESAAKAMTACLGVYPPLMREAHLLCPEALAFFLICGFMFHYCASYNVSATFKFHSLAAALYLAYLALAKVFFGYVIVAALALSSTALVWKGARKVRTGSLVFLLATVLCVPYLLYTYSLSGKVFYWGTSGGLQLYWMSTPYPKEYGSWFSVNDVRDRAELAPHRPFFDKIQGLPDAARDDALKARAVENIAHHPTKYVLNCAANLGRLLFSYPFSFANQSPSTYFYLVPNMFLVVLLLLSFIPGIWNYRAVPFEIWTLMIFALIAFSAAGLLSAYERQFRPLVPIFCLWMTYVYVRLLRIEFRSPNEISGSVYAEDVASTTAMTS
jgi:hypothetical protein